MYIWKPELGVIGNVMALINDHNSTHCAAENYHAGNHNDIVTAEQLLTDVYLDMVQAQQDITDLQIQIWED